MTKKTVAEIPAELTIKTTALKQSLEKYPKDGGVLLSNYEQVVMETPQCGRILCNVTLTIYSSTQT